MTHLKLGFVVFLVSLATVGFLAGCSGARPEASPPSDLRRAATDADLRRAAMFSVYFYSLYSSSEWVPEGLRPIDLLEAARLLKRDEAPFAASRRHRAIANLAAAGLDDPRRREALTILEAPIEEIEALLADLLPKARAHRPATAADPACQMGGITDLVDLATIDQVIVPAVLSFLTSRLGPAIPDCIGKFAVLSTDYSLLTRRSSVVVGGWVERDYAVVCEQMDPQHWDECSDYFTETHIALKSGSDYPVEPDFSVKADPNPPARCASYDRELYERFDIAFDMGDGTLNMAWYKQLLTIESETPSSGAGHVYEYELYDGKAIRSVVGIDERNGGLDTNQGQVTLTWNASENRTEIELSKTVRFSDRPLIDIALNPLATVTLRAMAGELHEMVCCGL